MWECRLDLCSRQIHSGPAQHPELHNREMHSRDWRVEGAHMTGIVIVLQSATDGLDDQAYQESLRAGTNDASQSPAVYLPAGIMILRIMFGR